MSLLKKLKASFRRPRKPGLPPNARPYQDIYVVEETLQDRKAFYEKVYGIKFPKLKTREIVIQWWPLKVTIKNPLKEFLSSQKFLDMLVESETLTTEEINRHVVKDWDYMVEGFDYEAFLLWLAKVMEEDLQNDGDVCMLPAGAFPGDCKMGLMNVGGVIKPFQAKDGTPRARQLAGHDVDPPAADEPWGKP